MLKPRIIPFLLFHKDGLYKSKQFKDHKYVGDPLNAVRIFNEKNVDELVFLDIDSSVNNNPINYGLLSRISRECRMPLCYGGGVKNIDQFEKIISLGIEKVSLSSAAINNPNLVEECANRVGSQSVVVTLDLIKTKFLNKKIEIMTFNGKKKIDLKLKDAIKLFQDKGAGEIIINCIDRDGTKKGYDYSIVEEIYSEINIPMTFVGGAKSYEDFKELFFKYEGIAAGAGSLFVFKGKFDAVLIQYPTLEEKGKILNI